MEQALFARVLDERIAGGGTEHRQMIVVCRDIGSSGGQHLLMVVTVHDRGQAELMEAVFAVCATGALLGVA